MEPQLPSPHAGPERAPVSPAAERARPQLGSPELAPVQPSPEQHETRETQPSGPGDPVAQVQPVDTPPPLPQIQQPQQQTTSTTNDDTPPAAADEDLIEKEWVDKAKKVIAETKHDPFLQEQAVSKLQADYLQKRYNKTVKVPGESA